MSDPKRGEGSGRARSARSASSATPPAVLSAAAVADSPEDLAYNVSGINQRALEAVRANCCADAAPADAAPARLPAAVHALREAWKLLGDDALRRLARSSYLLVDARFTDAGAWHAAVAQLAPTSAGAPLQPGPSPFVNRARAVAPAALEPSRSLFDAGAQAAFAGTLYLYAWHLARATPIEAAAALGAAPAVVELLASLSLPSVDSLSRRCAGWVTLRWAEQPAAWANLLAAANAADPAALRAERLKGLQRIAGQCLAAAGATPGRAS